MTTAINGHGATLSSCADTNFASVTTFGQITNISGPNLTRDSIDVSNMGSTEGWKEHIKGMLDGGEITADVIYDGTTFASAMYAQFTNPTAYWRVTMNDHTTAASRSNITCAGFVTSLGHTIPVGDKVSQSVTIKLTGVASYNPHA